jgi:hypothetical protein
MMVSIVMMRPERTLWFDVGGDDDGEYCHDASREDLVVRCWW